MTCENNVESKDLEEEQEKGGGRPRQTQDQLIVKIMERKGME